MVKNHGTTAEMLSISRVNKYKTTQAIVIPPTVIKSNLSDRGILSTPVVNSPIGIATKIPIKLEKSTKPPEPRLPVEYLVTRYLSEIFTIAHKNGAPKAIKNHCILLYSSNNLLNLL